VCGLPDFELPTYPLMVLLREQVICKGAASAKLYLQRARWCVTHLLYAVPRTRPELITTPVTTKHECKPMRQNHKSDCSQCVPDNTIGLGS